MIIIIAILALIVILSIILILKPNKQKNVSKPEIDNLSVKPNEEIEVLDLNDYDENTLNLDDLFKTISITKIEDDPNFDFDLRKTTKKS